MWIDPSISGSIIVWCRPWPTDISAELVSDKNSRVALTDSDIELAVLVFHGATLLEVRPDANMAAPDQDQITHPTCPGAHGIHLPSTRWLRTYSPSSCSTQGHFFYPRSSTIQARRTAWQTTYTAFLKYLTHRFLNTCLSLTRSHKLCGNSTPRRRNCFHV